MNSLKRHKTLVVRRAFLLVFLTTLIAGCAQQATKPASGSQQTGTSIEQEDEAPAILDTLPAEIYAYEYAGYKYYGKALGYSFRYVKENENANFADVYFWQTPQDIKHLSHQAIVYAVTEAAIADIETMAARGYYSNVQFLDRVALSGDGQILTLHTMTMLQGNLAMLSFLYVSEYRGHLLKARISMPDNDFNRNRDDVQPFIEVIFSTLMDSVDRAYATPTSHR